jgi:hypothetical protein
VPDNNSTTPNQSDLNQVGTAIPNEKILTVTVAWFVVLSVVLAVMLKQRKLKQKT